MINPDMLRAGQGPRLAFLDKADPEEIATSLVAFANTEGGTIIIGLTARGKKPRRQIDPADIEKALREADNLYNPPVVVDHWEEVQLREDYKTHTPDAKPDIFNIIKTHTTDDDTNTDKKDTDKIVGDITTTENQSDSQSAVADDSSATKSVDAKKADDSKKTGGKAKTENTTKVVDTKKADDTAKTIDTKKTDDATKVVDAKKTDDKASKVVDAKKTDDKASKVVDAKKTDDKDSKVTTTAKAKKTEKDTVTAETVIPDTSGASKTKTIGDDMPLFKGMEIDKKDPEKDASKEKTPEKQVKEFTVYAVRVPRSIELHAMSDGRVLIRSGAKNRPLGGQEILRLASAKNTGAFESEVIPGASREDFSRDMIEEYLSKRAERTKRPYNGKIDDLLREIGAITADGTPAITGILLFTDYPQQWIPQSSVVFAKFVGTTPRGESGLAGYTRREEITGPLPRLIEGAWNLIWSEMAVSAVVKGLEREEKTEYPQFAVREAIVNSICHRDYRLRGRRIELRMYSDRLEVISPGGLPGFITVENIKDEHFSRNPRLVNGLFQWGYIEELGLGIDRMMEVMAQAGHQPPLFDARPYSFAVTLYNAREKPAQPEWTRNTNHRQTKALQYIRENGSITNREYRGLCAGISAETLRLDLVDMVEKGILIKVGSKKGTHYILK